MTYRVLQASYRFCLGLHRLRYTFHIGFDMWYIRGCKFGIGFHMFHVGFRKFHSGIAVVMKVPIGFTLAVKHVLFVQPELSYKQFKKAQ